MAMQCINNVWYSTYEIKKLSNLTKLTNKTKVIDENDHIVIII